MTIQKYLEQLNKRYKTGISREYTYRKDLDSKNYKEQFTRYRKALDNLIITDYICFKFFKEGEPSYRN